MHRILHPELLDSLSPEHPDALHNRRDLRRVNAMLGNHRWFARTLPRIVRPDERILELGAGTGELGRRLARQGLAVDGLDVCPRPRDWPRMSAWHQLDLRGFDAFAPYRVVIGNLIFHQFADEELRLLGARLAPHARVVVAAEPARRRISQLLYRVAAPALGANYVSRHDGHVSIQAGFRGHELPQLLGLAARDWDIRCHATLRGICRMVAIRRA